MEKNKSNKFEEIPKSISIILDGSRRFAKRLGLVPFKGHDYGAKKIENLFDWCKELGIKELTLYCFSMENFNRSKKEVDYLMNIFRREFKKLLKDKRVYEDKLKVNFIGRLWMLPKDLQAILQQLMEATKDHDNYKVNFALAYGGRAEIVDATKKIAQSVKEGKLDVKDINEEVFSKNVYLESEPDLIIRTSDEKRLSGFLLWQGSYSELYFCHKLWPEFEKGDLIAAIEDYDRRKRRFGR